MCGVVGWLMIFKCFVKGIFVEVVFQKCVLVNWLDWVDVVELYYVLGCFVVEVVIYDVVGLVWVINLGCVDFNLYLVFVGDFDYFDELWVDLDLMFGVVWQWVVEVVLVVWEVLEDYGLIVWLKMFGLWGFYVYVWIVFCWLFFQVCLVVQIVVCEVEWCLFDVVISCWWKEECEGVFVDFNQNVKDCMVVLVYLVWVILDVWVFMLLYWEEVFGCDLVVFIMVIVFSWLVDIGDFWVGMDDVVGWFDWLLMLVEELGLLQKV